MRNATILPTTKTTTTAGGGTQKVRRLQPVKKNRM